MTAALLLTLAAVILGATLHHRRQARTIARQAESIRWFAEQARKQIFADLDQWERELSGGAA